MAERQVRIGIDVGGTYTKAVAIDNATHDIIGKSSIKTTHDDPSGVAAGVVITFQNVLKENNINPEDVIFVAHSTTQATNALVEGDVANVGIVGVANGGLEGLLAKKQVYINDIEIAQGKTIKIFNCFLKRKQLTDARIREEIENLRQQGAQVIVASMAFGVDAMGEEQQIQTISNSMGLLTTIAAEITKLYGLTRRTRTAAINASILPKMLKTATSTESSVRAAGVTVPLMIMRGDGGVMEITEMKKRPVLTMLSGPAASVMGSLMYLRASNGIYFEVGGTTTNIGVIKNGRPAIDYSVVGGHRTYINSLDVQVTGCAGGSMVRISKTGVSDVGPRSAHIAGLDYAVYTPLEEIEEPKLELFSPKPGDPSDYVAVRLKSGKLITITNSCAANALGLVTPDLFSYGSAESARKAMQPVADHLNITVDELATQIMERSYDKIAPIVLELTEKYKVEHEQISLVGVGGGAASIIIYFAKKMSVRYNIPQNAEVISSIGVALAMVRDVVERIIPNPSPQDIKNIRQEAVNKAIESGAVPDSIEVHVEIDSQTSKVTAIALGSTEVKTADLLSECTEKEAQELAQQDFGQQVTSACELSAKTNFFYVFTATKGAQNPIRIVDKKGFIRVQRTNGITEVCKAKDYVDVVKRMHEDMATYNADSILRPDYYLCIGGKIADVAGNGDLEQILMLMDIEVMQAEPEDDIIIACAKNQL